MENEQKMLYEMNIEKAKALFEYEMTSVLLAEKEEDEAAKERIRQYMEMEIEKPEVSYNAPELAPAEIKAEIKAEKTAVPDFELPKAELTFRELPEIKETRAFASPVLFAETVLHGTVRIPETEIKASEAFSSEKLFSLPEKADAGLVKGAAEISEAGKAAEKLNGAQIRETVELLNTGASAEVTVSGPGLKLPGTGKAEVRFAALTAEKPRTDIKVSEGIKIPAGTKIPEGMEIKLPGNLPEAEVSAGEISVPEGIRVPEVSLSFKSPGTGNLHIKAAADDIKLPDPDKLSFTLPPAKKVDVSVDYSPAVPVSFETVKPVETKYTAPEYPEIPDAPDISAYVDDIIETIRSDLK